MNVVIVMLQRQGTSHNVVESREGLKHLMHNGHVEELWFAHRQEVDFMDLIVVLNISCRLLLRLLRLAQIEAQGLKYRRVVLLAVVKVNLVYN